MEVKDYCCYCGTCTNICPQNAIELLDVGKVEIDMEKCNKCKMCIKTCPLGAIHGL